MENILLKIIQAADGDIERAEYGIIYIDEIDKITRKIRKIHRLQETYQVRECRQAALKNP